MKSMSRNGLVEEAVVRLTSAAGGVEAVGAAVTVALCGHWDHSGPCRWPHNTSASPADGGAFTVVTIVIVDVADEPLVRSAIRQAVGAGELPGVEAAGSWEVVTQRTRPMTPDEARVAGRLAARR